MKKIKKFLKKVRLEINKFNSKKRSKKILKQNPTIISNNCYAGIIYEYLGLPFSSPTIGLLIYPGDYIKFCSNFDYYISKRLRFINFNDSHNKEEMIKRNQQNSIIGILDDVEIVFLHYKTKDEAFNKWNRRCKRINKKCLIFKFNDQNGCTYDDLKMFNELLYPNKICFTSHEYKEFNSCIWLKCDKKKNEVQKDYYTSHRYINIIDYINRAKTK